MRRFRYALAVSIVLLAPLFLPTRSRAADDPAAGSLRAGSWAMMFQITDNFQLSSFDGAAISIKHHTSDRKAWRLGFGFGGTIGLDRDNVQQLEASNGFTTDYTSHEDIGNQSLSLDLLRVMYPEVEGRVRPFWGVGPTIGYSNTTNESNEVRDTVDVQTVDRSSKSWVAGLELKLGVEVFAAKRISILGEYGTSFTYVHTNIEEDRQSVFSGFAENRHAGSSSDGFQFGNQSVRLGVSAYF